MVEKFTTIFIVTSKLKLKTIIFFSNNLPDYDLDLFEATPAMSSFSFGFVISDLSAVNDTKGTDLEKPIVKIWGRNDFHHDLTVNLNSFFCKKYIKEDVNC